MRYCDDFIACFQHEDEAHRFRRNLAERVAAFDLEVELELTHDRVQRSVPMITHRTERLADMNQILFLEQGRVTTRGDHGYLLDRLPAYRELWGVLDG